MKTLLIILLALIGLLLLSELAVTLFIYITACVKVWRKEHEKNRKSKEHDD